MCQPNLNQKKNDLTVEGLGLLLHMGPSFPINIWKGNGLNINHDNFVY